jgi:xanthine dehydrogenase YagS FAD-binding subunit
MQPFNYQNADEISSAISTHKKMAQSAYLAGGTNIVDLLKLHVEKPHQLVDISSLKLKTLTDDGKNLQIGALMTNADLANHKLIIKHAPVLSQAILSGASPQLRNLATTSGNLLQRTRCNYFRDTACPCNKREPGSGCSALEGVNRNLAILGVSEACIASNPSDMNVALMALDAVVHLHGPGGERNLPIANFYRLPEKTPHLETNLEADELITRIDIPKTAWFAKSLYVKVRDRASYSFALTSAAVALNVEKGIVKDLRIALGGVGSIPWRSREAESILRGEKLSQASIAMAAKAAFSDAQARPGNKFKVSLGQRTLISAIQKCGGVV